MKRLLFIFSSLIVLASCTVETAPMLNLTTTDATIQSDGGFVTVEFTASTEWEAFADQSWVKFDKSSGEGSQIGHCTLSIGAEPSESYRSATVTIRCGSLQKNISVKQYGSNFFCIGETAVPINYAAVITLSSTYVLSFSDAELDGYAGYAQINHPWVYVMVTSLESGSVESMYSPLIYYPAFENSAETDLSPTELEYEVDSDDGTLMFTCSGDGFCLTYSGPVSFVDYKM